MRTIALNLNVGAVLRVALVAAGMLGLALIGLANLGATQRLAECQAVYVAMPTTNGAIILLDQCAAEAARKPAGKQS